MEKDNSYDHFSSKEKNLLLSLSKDITSCQSKEAILDLINNKLGAIFQYNAVTVSLVHPNKINHGAYLYTLPEEMLSHPELAARAAEKYIVNDGVYDVLLKSSTPVTYDLEELMKRKIVPGYVDFFYKNGIREMVAFPIRIDGETVGGLWIHSKQKKGFTKAQINLSEVVCSHITIALSHIWAYEKIESQLAEIEKYKAQLEQENVFLQQQIQNISAHSFIIGSSEVWKNVFELIAHVAGSDSTVLLYGETGTGKELVARVLHESSSRKGKQMIKVNCAALPPTLIESELFGHEKGSFTGAIDKRIGKFEMAHNSTLLLDEIGELPLELQVKILRVIQEKEIERVGGNTSIKTNVRIIAATNRNLQNEVDAGKFRMDLFYRLNVFPINLPPLRERKEDIPLLAAHFMKEISVKCRKNVINISQKALDQMMAYEWPGNVREMEHLIERAVLLTDGTTIKEVNLPVKNKKGTKKQEGGVGVQSIQEMEREHILSVLKKTNGKIHGPAGAAELLKIPSTTLASKMKKLGIQKTHV
jgi:transcriptional regulator with GAF, ATPase, and Fis domain